MMKTQIFGAVRGALVTLMLGAMVVALSPSTASAQAEFVIKPLAEKKVAELPSGPLYWQVESFPTLAEAEAAAGATALATEAEGKVWLFTLGPQGAMTPGGTKVVEIGPVPRITAPEYLLRINSGIAPPGAKTSVHTHPGAETFYVLSGQLTQKTPEGVSTVDVGQTKVGIPDTPMEVSSSGTTDLHELIMFLVDASKPFSSPATLE